MRKQRTLRAMFVLATLPFLAINAAWLRSHFRADQVGWIADAWGLVIDSDNGSVQLTFSNDPNTVGRMQFQAGLGLV